MEVKLLICRCAVATVKASLSGGVGNVREDWAVQI